MVSYRIGLACSENVARPAFGFCAACHSAKTRSLDFISAVGRGDLSDAPGRSISQLALQGSLVLLNAGIVEPEPPARGLPRRQPAAGAPIRHQGLPALLLVEDSLAPLLAFLPRLNALRCLSRITHRWGRRSRAYVEAQGPITLPEAHERRRSAIARAGRTLAAGTPAGSLVELLEHQLELTLLLLKALLLEEAAILRAHRPAGQSPG